MWKCINCDKENADNQGRCVCGYDRTTEYTRYFTITQLHANEMEQYSQQTFGNENAKAWMDWAISVKQQIQDMEDAVAETIMKQMKQYYETIVHSQMIKMVHAFVLDKNAEKNICADETKQQWLRANTESLPEDVKWNLEGNLWLFGVDRPKDAKKAVQAYIKSAQLGSSDALVNLGNCYVYGKSLERNLRKARDCYIEASELGNEIAHQNLKILSQKIVEEKNQRWKENILMSDWGNWSTNEERPEAKVLGSKITRKEIVSVTILDTLAHMPVNSWDVSQNKDKKVMAWVKRNRGKYDLYIAGEGGINAQNCANLFGGYINVERICLNGHFHTDYAESLICLFDNCYKLREVDVSTLNTANTTNMRGMFGECRSLTFIDLSNFNTSKVVTMYAMFYGCTGLGQLDVSSFDTSNVTNMEFMFSKCEKLQTLDISTFNTSNVTNMYAMFTNCQSLKNLNMKNLDTSSVENMGFMFSKCARIKKLDVRSFDTSKVTDMGSMFMDCTSLEELDVSNFNTRSVTKISWMFYGCYCITAKKIAHFDMRNVKEKQNMLN